MFRPSHESLLLQNAEVDRLELPRIQDDDELEALKFSGALQPIIPGVIGPKGRSPCTDLC